MRLGRPVKWTEDRREHLIAANQERGQVHDVEVAVDADGRILALRDHFIHDTGAYTPYGIVVPIITATQLPGPTACGTTRSEFEVAYTNKAACQPLPRRRPPARRVRDGADDRPHRPRRSVSSQPRCADATSSSPTSSHGTSASPFRTAGRRATTAATTRPGWRWRSSARSFATFRARQAEARDARGVTWASGSGATSRARASARTRARTYAWSRAARCSSATGLTTQGQGHDTTFAQIVAEVLGCDASRGHRRSPATPASSTGALAPTRAAPW